MQHTSSDFLILDNCKPQTGNADLLDELGITGPGFAAEWVKDDGGAPSSSPDSSIFDAGLFKPFDDEFKRANPMNIGQAVARATKIWDAIPQSEVLRHISTFRDRLQQIIDADGGASDWMGSQYKQRW